MKPHSVKIKVRIALLSGADDVVHLRFALSICAFFSLLQLVLTIWKNKRSAFLRQCASMPMAIFSHLIALWLGSRWMKLSDVSPICWRHDSRHSSKSPISCTTLGVTNLPRVWASHALLGVLSLILLAFAYVRMCNFNFQFVGGSLNGDQ